MLISSSPARLLVVIVLTVFCGVSGAVASNDPRIGDPPGTGWQEVVAPGVRVLFEEPRLEQYAQNIAVRAEVALARLAELFRTDPPVVTLTLDGRTDSYSAVAPPLPRPRVYLPASFPASTLIDLRTEDPLNDLLLHELAHSVQLTYLQRPDGTPQVPRLGLLGETVAPVPPGWLLEGIAVWAAEALGSEPEGGADSEDGGNGSASMSWGADARARGLLASLALEGNWPSLTDVSLLSHDVWPAGEARYLLGGAFVAWLVDSFGWEAMLSAFQEANAGWHLMSFQDAWHRATGLQLDELWLEWSEELRARAVARAARQPEEELREWRASGQAGTVLALNEAGTRVAWWSGSRGLLVADLASDTAAGGAGTGTGAGADVPNLEEARVLLPPRVRPLSLDWAGPDRLVFSRLVRGTDAMFADLYELDLSNGALNRLTYGERVRFPEAGPEGCIYYIRDVVPDGSDLRRLCPGGEVERLTTAADGEHFVGLAVSAEGRLALSVWRSGFVDLALLEEGSLRWLTEDPAQDLDPVWSGEDELVFRSDRSEVFELYALEPGKDRLRLLTSSLGGAFAPTAGGNLVAYARLGGSGYGLAALPLERTIRTVPLRRAHLPDRESTQRSYAVRPYRPGPSLAPFGWLPEVSIASVSPLRLSVAARIFAQDRSGDHSWTVAGGHAAGFAGPLGGGWLSLDYGYRTVDVFDLFQRSPPVSFGVRLGAWPHTPHLQAAEEIAVGARAALWLRAPLGDWSGLVRLRAGGLHLHGQSAVQPDARVDAVVSRRFADIWGYGVAGARLSLHGVYSASVPTASTGMWFDLSSVQPVGGASTEFAVRGGYRQPPPAPLTLEDWSVIGTAVVRRHLPLHWRVRDGLVAVERLTLEGRGHLGYDGTPRAATDLSIWADTMLRYGAPVSFGGTVGYATGWWYRLELGMPL